MADELQRITAKLPGERHVTDMVIIGPVIGAHLVAVGRVMACINLQKPVVRKIRNRPERQLISPDSNLR